jgi:hypothetical protein
MYWKPYVCETKSGFQILIDMPKHCRPHVVKDDLPSETSAVAWQNSEIGREAIEAVVAYYKGACASNVGPFI